MGDLHFQSPLFVDKPRPGGRSPSPKAAQGVREAKLFLGILPPLLASRKQPERRDRFVKSSLSPRGMSQYFPLRDRAWQRSLPGSMNLLELCSWLLASVGQSSHVVRLGPSLLGWVRRGEPCPSSGNSLCYLPTDGKCSMHSANVHWIPATMPGSAGTGGYSGEADSPGLCPHRARIQHGPHRRAILNSQ